MNTTWGTDEHGNGFIRFRKQTSGEEMSLFAMRSSDGFHLEWEQEGEAVHILRVVADHDSVKESNDNPGLAGMSLGDLKTLAAENSIELPATANRAIAMHKLKGVESLNSD